jgi:hypothetical protein
MIGKHEVDDDGHVCGYKNAALTLADCTWPCPICGTLHDRDLNAALNIRDEKLRILAVAGPPKGSGEPKRLRRSCKTTDGGTPRRSKNPTALAVWSVKRARCAGRSPCAVAGDVV